MVNEIFTLAQYVESETAHRNNITEQFNPPTEVIKKLKLLHEIMVLPLIKELGAYSLFITSGYRSPKTNELVKGSKTSQHCKAEAVDISYFINGQKANLKLYETVKRLDLPYDQIIKEYGNNSNPAWIHISMSERNRRQELVIQ